MNAIEKIIQSQEQLMPSWAAEARAELAALREVAEAARKAEDLLGLSDQPEGGITMQSRKFLKSGLAATLAKLAAVKGK